MSSKEQDHRILIGFSGGADSAAAASMLLEQGLAPTALYLRMGTHADKGLQAAEQAAGSLHIPLISLDVSGAFEHTVVQPFCRAYAGGETPNPCIICNPDIKFDALCREADRLGIERIATGHYARIGRDQDGKPYLRRAASVEKDQSYMLYKLSAETLNRCVFPLGEVASKQEVRSYLQERKIAVWDAPESMDICFIQEGSYTEFLKNRGIDPPEGHFVDAGGNVLGVHQGIHRYTPGQRKGLGVTFGTPMYVIGSDAGSNNVILGCEEELYRRIVWLRDLVLTDVGEVGHVPEPWQGASVEVKLRYSTGAAQAVLLAPDTGGALLLFDELQRAPAPGQSAVLYRGDRVLGGGIIVGSSA